MDNTSTIDKILDVALREFAMHGIEGISSRQIAKVAGVNHASINYYFGSKQEMYVEIAQRAISYFKEKFRDIYAKVDVFLASGILSKEQAIIYIKELFALARRDILKDSFANFQLLIRREEVFPTEAFDLLFTNVFKPHMTLISALVRVAKPDMSQSQAYVIANLFMSMNLSQIHCKEGIIRLHNKDTFDSDLANAYSENIDLIIEKFLK